MQKHVTDTSVIGTFVVPLNVQKVVAAIEAEAKQVYTDHRDSQQQFVRERLIQELSEREARITEARRMLELDGRVGRVARIAGAKL